MKLTAGYRATRESVLSVPQEDRPAMVMKEVLRDWGLCGCGAERRETFLRRLTQGQRAFLFVLSLESQVESDGFYLYLWNSGEEAVFAVEALREIGATKYVPILQAALAMFRGPQVLGSRRIRHAALKKHFEADVNKRFQAPFDALNRRKKDSLTAHLISYLKKRPEEFFVSRVDRNDSAAPQAAFPEYRVPRSKVAELRGVKLHCALLAPIWQDYCAATRPNNQAGSRRLDRLASSLTPGQRALAAVKLFDNAVRLVGCSFAVKDLARVHKEILLGYHLLGAKPYAELFRRMVTRSREWDDALGKSECPLRELVEKRKRLAIQPGDPRFAGISDAFWKAYTHQMKLQQGFSREQKAWRKEYLALGKLPTKKLERLVEDYVESHSSEFFSD